MGLIGIKREARVDIKQKVARSVVGWATFAFTLGLYNQPHASGILPFGSMLHL